MKHHYSTDRQLHTVTERNLNRTSRPIQYYKDENGCHIAISHRRCRDGYPKVERNHREWTMSRYIYTLFKGAIPEGLYVRHLCHNPNCINPDHLTVGTQKENMADKKLNPKLANSTKKKRRLTDDEVRSIRAAKEKGVTELTKLYGISYTTIRQILAGKIHRNTNQLFN